MRVLTYAGLNAGSLRSSFEKLVAAIERDDFRSADVKKLNHGPYYRAKLNDADRLLLQFVEHHGHKACLALEIIENHAYDRSRFLRGASVDESKIESAGLTDPGTLEAEPIRYLHPERREFHVQAKPLSFDDAQARIHATPPPLLLVGTAGSGKTALTLEKLRQAGGDVLYVTQSAYLANSARTLYFAHGYENEGQAVDFLSHRELLESVRVPTGRPVAFRDFRGFWQRHRQAYKFADAHQCFEEFRGVLGAQPEGPLSLDAYVALGVRQAIFDTDQRRVLHGLFEKYHAFLVASGLYDTNLVSQQYRPLVTPRYDFVVVDEVQDLTNAELALVLAMLRRPGQFVLAGDANQVVHPNFFSWSGVKGLFFREPRLAERQRLEMLDVNFRNARAVTRVANALLRIKQARFGSIDRESNVLVRPVATDEGSVEILPADGATLADLDRKTARSTRVALLVLRDEDKAEARRHFSTPLLFSVHEAKGLEYESVVLFRFIASEPAAFADVCDGVERGDLDGDELPYRRATDKGDKSLEVYKFYVNALYVALTRAVHHAYLVESDPAHPLLSLLEVHRAASADSVTANASSIEEWQSEARRLEQQGKREQAEAIRSTILQTAPVPWVVMDDTAYGALMEKAFAPGSPFNKAKQSLYGFACAHDNAPLAQRLDQDAGFSPAAHFARDVPVALAKALAPYAARKPGDVLSWTARYGVEFRSAANLTPLMMAAAAGNVPLVEALLARGARRDPIDPFGRTAAHGALLQAWRSPAFARGPLAAIWDLVVPDALDVQVDGRLFKIGREQGEYFYLIATGALWPTLLRSRLGRYQGLTTALLTSGGLDHLPSNVVRPERRKRTYINHLFARNELSGSYIPNRKLWVRERTGHYVPNPALLLRVPVQSGEVEWRPIRVVLGDAIMTDHWLPGGRARAEPSDGALKPGIDELF